MYPYKRFFCVLLLAAFVLTGIGCDANGSDDDASINGLWQHTSAAVYLQVDADEVVIYEHTPAGTLGNATDCYLTTTFAILDVENNVYTLRDADFGQEIDVTMTRNGDVLTTVMTIDGSPNTVRYNKSSQSVGSLQPGC